MSILFRSCHHHSSTVVVFIFRRVYHQTKGRPKIRIGYAAVVFFLTSKAVINARQQATFRSHRGLGIPSHGRRTPLEAGVLKTNTLASSPPPSHHHTPQWRAGTEPHHQVQGVIRLFNTLSPSFSPRAAATIPGFDPFRFFRSGSFPHPSQLRFFNQLPLLPLSSLPCAHEPCGVVCAGSGSVGCRVVASPLPPKNSRPRDHCALPKCHFARG